MEKKEKIKYNNDGTYIKVETIETTPEDGFVEKRKINPLDMDNYHKYHKGYSQNKVFTTNDPRIMRPFVFIVCGLFWIIGTIFLLISFLKTNIMTFLFGLSFLAISTWSFFKAKKDIDNVEKKLLKNSNYNPDDKKVIEGFKKDIKSDFNEINKSVFTKEKLKWFLKTSLIMYSVIAITIFIILSILINIFLGLFILVFLILIGFLYYWLISKMFK